MNKKKLFFEILIVAIFIFLVSNIYLLLFESTFIYYPNPQSFEDCEHFTQEQMKAYNETRFYHEDTNEENITIVYHGNAGRACDRYEYRDKIGNKTSLVLVEYAGYAGSEKRPTKRNILQDSDNIQAWLDSKNYSQERVIGESLGTSLASYHAMNRETEKLALIAPFSSMEKLARDVYPWFLINSFISQDYDVIKYLSTYDDDLLLVHGTEDKLINIDHSRTIYESMRDQANVTYLPVEGAGHTDISEFDIVGKTYRKWVST